MSDYLECKCVKLRIWRLTKNTTALYGVVNLSINLQRVCLYDAVVLRYQMNNIANEIPKDSTFPGELGDYAIIAVLSVDESKQAKIGAAQFETITNMYSSLTSRPS